MESKEIIIKEDGAVLERIVRERELEVGPSALEALTETVKRSLPRVLAVPGWGVAHANVGKSDTLWSVPIDHLELNTRFRLVDGALVPAFVSPTDMEMRLVWKAPPRVRLVFAVLTKGLEAPEDIKVEGNWLFACDEARRAYRLPLPNLHDDSRICTGTFEEFYPTAAAALAASLEQFRKSRWNADLLRTTEESQRFFRFRPTDADFEPLPVDAPDWTSLCQKVSTAITERIIL